MTSLPVPLSPCTRTGTLVRASFSRRSRTASILVLCPKISSSGGSSPRDCAIEMTGFAKAIASRWNTLLKEQFRLSDNPGGGSKRGLLLLCPIRQQKNHKGCSVVVLRLAEVYHCRLMAVKRFLTTNKRNCTTWSTSCTLMHEDLVAGKWKNPSRAFLVINKTKPGLIARLP